MNQQLHTLPDGACIGYAEYGDPAGRPVLFCHGAPGSRLQITPAMAQIANGLHVRLIVPDRPGYGNSNLVPGRSLLDWPVSLTALLDALGVERFGVIGYSMGGMYALACAHVCPQRVTHVALAGSMSPDFLHQDVIEKLPASSIAIFEMARDAPDVLQQNLAPLAETPQLLLAMFAQPMPKVDQLIFRRPEITTMYLQDCIESLKNNVDGLVTDFTLATANWGFMLEKIKTRVDLWHGAEDCNVPFAAARNLTGKLPCVEQHLLPNEGHLCLFDHWEEILDSPKGRDGSR